MCSNVKQCATCSNAFPKPSIYSLSIFLFQACIIFARDLWGQKNVEKPEVIHHHAPRIMGPSSQNRFPFDDFMDDIPEPFDIMDKDDGKSEDEPHLVKTTKITFKLMPKDGEEFPGAPFGMKQMGFGGPEMDDGFINDILKTMMGMMNRPEQRRQPSFGDLPFFNGPNNPRPMHPKLIIVRKLPSAQQEDEDVLKNLLNGLSAPVHPADKYKRPMGTFPLFPNIRPIQRSDDGPDGNADSLISKIIRDFGLGTPLGGIVIKKKPLTATNAPELSGAEGWKKYKTLVSKLAQEVDLILDTTSSLKQTVAEELNKIKDETPGAPSDGSYVPKPENPSKDFLSGAMESLNKIGIALTEVSIVIKTEDGAMDLVNKSDKKSLVNTIESFLKELNGPLGEVFSTSTALTKMAGKEGVSQPVLKGIVGVASKIVDFGKIIYEDISKLSSTVGDSAVAKPAVNILSPLEPVEEPKSNPEPTPQPTDAPTDEPEKKLNVFFEPIEPAQPESEDGQK